MLKKSLFCAIFLLSMMVKASSGDLPIAVLVNDTDFREEVSDVEKCLIFLGSKYEIYKTFDGELPEPGTFSGLIIDGGLSMSAYFDDDGNKLDGALLVENSGVPVFGICLGGQIIERIYGGWLELFEQRGWAEITIVKEDVILDGLEKEFEAWENHGFGFAILPDGFELLCRGEKESIQLMRHEELPIYASMFHPEMSTGDDNPAKIIMENFVSYVLKYAEEMESGNNYASRKTD